MGARPLSAGEIHALVIAEIPQTVGNQPALIDFHGPGHMGAMAQDQGGAPVDGLVGELNRVAPVLPQETFGGIGYAPGAAALGAGVDGNQQYLVFFGQGGDFRQGRPG